MIVHKIYNKIDWQNVPCKLLHTYTTENSDVLFRHRCVSKMSPESAQGTCLIVCVNSACVILTHLHTVVSVKWYTIKDMILSSVLFNPLAAIDAKMRHLHPPQVQALSRAH